jgi:putative 4-mercaptohistidine N1-methyltranferase
VAGNIYESDRLVREYLLFHYGAAEEILPWPGGPREALDFAVRSVHELLDQKALPAKARALDIGCAVGRSAFELAALGAGVTALDFSQAFIDAAETIRLEGKLDYRYVIEGDRTAAATARRPANADPDRLEFAVGDAMSLPESLGTFDVVHAANLICRLPDPRVFLRRLPELVRRGGQLLLTTPFTWLEEFTPCAQWIGGTENATSAEALDALLAEHFTLEHVQELPFLIREHARKFQWSVARGTRWIRR